MIRLILAVSAAMLVVGCAAEHVGRPAAVAATSGGASLPSAERICRDTFPESMLLGWTSATVGQLRAYQYGGQVAHVPLRTLFVGVPSEERGAWCWLRQGPGSGSLWGAVLGSAPQRAIIVTGPGEDRFRGEMQNAPVVP